MHNSSPSSSVFRRLKYIEENTILNVLNGHSETFDPDQIKALVALTEKVPSHVHSAM